MGYLRIPERALDALSVVAEMPVSEFKGLVDQLVKTSPQSIRASTLFSLVSELAGDDDFARALCSQLISLATFRRAEQVPISKVIDDFTRGLPHAEAEENIIEWFGQIADDFAHLLEAPIVKLTAKALQLSTDFESVFRSANVVTDLRPVYEDGRETVVGGIVTQVLRIHYISDGDRESEREVSLALDLDDIDKLIKELEKAKQKALAAKKQFEELLSTEVYIVGEETYGFG